MTSLVKKDFLDDPLDNVELAASIQNWTYDRSENEVSIIANGKHNNYQLSVSLRNDSQGLDVVCGFDLRFNEKNKFQILKLVSSINAQIWLGHFDVWTNELKLLFRYNLLLSGGVLPTTSQCQSLFKHIMDTADKYYPSFQYVIWGGNKADEAITNAIFTTIGES